MPWMIASELNMAYLAHHGIQGQRWGIRRYQNEDGSLTPEGHKRYGIGRPNKWAGENSVDRMNKRSKDIIKTVKKEAKAKNEKLSDEELYKRVKKEYGKIYKDKKLADIVYAMDMGKYKFNKQTFGGVFDVLAESGFINKGYNKKGFESPEQTMTRAMYEYQNYYNKDKKIPEYYKQFKKQYKQTF